METSRKIVYDDDDHEMLYYVYIRMCFVLTWVWFLSAPLTMSEQNDSPILYQYCINNAMYTYFSIQST